MACSNPLRPSISSFLSSSKLLHRTQQFRHESSNRRIMQKLRIPPAPFLSSTPSTNTSQILYNPPSSAPNVFHTPLKFLPPSDPRRKLYEAARSLPRTPSIPGAQSSTWRGEFKHSRLEPVQPTPTPAATANALPPPVRQPYEKNYHLSHSQIQEMRELRTQNPAKWTRVKLAEKFKCSQFYVSLVVKAPEAARRQEEAIDAVKRRWGRKKREAREDRGRRKELWGRE